MSRFETGKELRKELEERSGKLSNEEWVSLKPDWSPPYGDADLAELLDAAERLPSRKAAKAAQKAQDFAADVQRLRQQLLAHSPERDALTIQADAGAGAWILHDLVEGSAAATLAAEIGELGPTDIASIHSRLGLAVHELLAADLLARRYGIHWVTAMNALNGVADVAEIRLGKVAKVERGLPTMAKSWARTGRFDNDPRVKAVRRDLRGILRMRRDRTKSLLWHTLGKKGVEWESWEDGRAVYEKAARKAEAGGEVGFKHFAGWRLFRVAANRLTDQLLTYRERVRKRKGPR